MSSMSMGELFVAYIVFSVGTFAVCWIRYHQTMKSVEKVVQYERRIQNRVVVMQRRSYGKILLRLMGFAVTDLPKIDPMLDAAEDLFIANWLDEQVHSDKETKDAG